jgi:hypothetical protein
MAQRLANNNFSGFLVPSAILLHGVKRFCPFRNFFPLSVVEAPCSRCLDRACYLRAIPEVAHPIIAGMLSAGLAISGILLHSLRD